MFPNQSGRQVSSHSLATSSTLTTSLSTSGLRTNSGLRTMSGSPPLRTYPSATFAMVPRGTPTAMQPSNAPSLDLPDLSADTDRPLKRKAASMEKPAKTKRPMTKPSDGLPKTTSATYKESLGQHYRDMRRDTDLWKKAGIALQQGVNRLQKDVKRIKRQLITELLGKKKPERFRTEDWFQDKVDRVAKGKVRTKGHYQPQPGSKLSRPLHEGHDIDMSQKSWLEAMVELRVVRKFLVEQHRRSSSPTYLHHVTRLNFPGGSSVFVLNEKGGGGGTTRMMMPLYRDVNSHGQPVMRVLDSSYSQMRELVCKDLMGRCGYSDQQLAQLMLGVLHNDPKAIQTLAQTKHELGRKSCSLIVGLNEHGQVTDQAFLQKPAYRAHAFKPAPKDLGGHQVTALQTATNVLSVLFLAEPRHALGTWQSTMTALALVRDGKLTFDALFSDLNQNIQQGFLLPGANWISGNVTKKSRNLAMKRMDISRDATGRRRQIQVDALARQPLTKATFIEGMAIQAEVVSPDKADYQQRQEYQVLLERYRQIPGHDPKWARSDKFFNPSPDLREDLKKSLLNETGKALTAYFNGAQKHVAFMKGSRHWQTWQAALQTVNPSQGHAPAVALAVKMEELRQQALADLADSFTSQSYSHMRFNMLGPIDQNHVRDIISGKHGDFSSKGAQASLKTGSMGRTVPEKLEQLVRELKYHRGNSDMKSFNYALNTFYEVLPDSGPVHDDYTAQMQEILEGLHAIDREKLSKVRGLSDLISGSGANALLETYNTHTGWQLQQWHTLGDDNCAFNGFAMGLMGLVNENRLNRLQLFQALQIGQDQAGRIDALMNDVFENRNRASAQALQRELQGPLRQLARECIGADPQCHSKLHNDFMAEVDHQVRVLSEIDAVHLPSDLFNDKPEIQQLIRSKAQQIKLAWDYSPARQQIEAQLTAGSRAKRRLAYQQFLQRHGQPGIPMRNTPLARNLFFLMEKTALDAIDRQEKVQRREEFEAFLDRELRAIPASNLGGQVVNKYQAAVGQNGVWGGGLELGALGRRLGVGMALCHPLGVDQGGRLPSTTIQFRNFNPGAGEFTRVEFQLLRSRDLITSGAVANHAAQAPVVIQPGSEAWVSQQLQDQSQDFRDRFLAVFRNTAKPPIIAMMNPHGFHWSALSTTDYRFNMDPAVFQQAPVMQWQVGVQSSASRKPSAVSSRPKSQTGMPKKQPSAISSRSPAAKPTSPLSSQVTFDDAFQASEHRDALMLKRFGIDPRQNYDHRGAYKTVLEAARHQTTVHRDEVQAVFEWLDIPRDKARAWSKSIMSKLKEASERDRY